MLIHDEFLVRHAVLYADFLAFRLRRWCICPADPRTARVGVIWRGKQHLLFTFRVISIPAITASEAAEFQAGASGLSNA